MLLRTLVALLAGAALSAAFEPVSARAVTPVCLAALLLAVRGLPPGRAVVPGLAFGVAFMGTLQVWMTAIGLDAFVGITLVEAAFFGPLAAALAVLQRLPGWPLWTAAAWVAVESVRIVWPFSGMPWGRLSYAVADTWWAQALPYAGFSGVSFLVALTGAVLAWALVGGWRRPALLAGAAAGLLVATLSPVLAPYQAEADGRAVVAVVQGDVPGDGTNVLLDHRQVTANHAEATRALARATPGAGDLPAGEAGGVAGQPARPDFVLWPENSTAVDPFLDPGVHDEVRDAVEAVGVPVLVGAMVEGPDPDQVMNQGVVWEPGVGSTDRYTKWHPVPFGEYIPWRDKIFRSNFGRLREIGRDMPGGTRPTPLRVGGVEVADAICFDVAYDDLFAAQLGHGARMITVQTSNAMFIETDQVAQQFEITRLRALASGRALAVASVNGISGVVRPDGTVQARADVRSTEVLVEEVPLSSALPPGVRLGPWPARVLAGVALVALGVALTRRPGVPYRRRATAAGVHAPARGPAGTDDPDSGLVPAAPTPQRGGAA